MIKRVIVLMNIATKITYFKTIFIESGSWYK